MPEIALYCQKSVRSGIIVEFCAYVFIAGEFILCEVTPAAGLIRAVTYLTDIPTLLSQDG
jgi:hypothetical protein